VRIPDPVKDCVAFVHYRKAMADPPKTAGTVFFVGMTNPASRVAGIYAVTARHVIEDCHEKSQDGKILMRAHIGGALEFIETRPDDWIFPSNR
jgi:hypothetical protein